MFTSNKRYPLVSLYQQKRELVYQPFSNILEVLLQNLFGSSEINVHQISSRVKSVSSFADKLRKKDGKYEILSDMTDLIGLRIITYLESDVDNVYKSLKRNFNIDELNSIDKRPAQSTNQFGYKSLHVVATLSDERSSLTEYSAYRRIPFEIQVRSILQHSWAEIEHDINYKSLRELPNDISRKLHRVAALLEQADEIFSEIGSDLAQKTSIDAPIGEFPACSKLNSTNLRLMLNQDEFLLKLERMLDTLNDTGLTEGDDPESILDMRIKDLESISITTIKELRTAILENEQNLFEFIALHLGKVIDDCAGNFYRSACLSMLGEFIIGKTGNYRKVLQYVTRNSGAGEYERETAKKIIKDVSRLVNQQA